MVQEQRSHVLVRWLPLIAGLLYSAGTMAYVVFGLQASGTLEDAVVGTVLVSAVGLPLGSLVGFAGRRLIEKNGASGGAVFAVMVAAGVAAWVAVALFMAAHPLDPDDVGMVTTSWVWGHLGWGGILLYFLTVPFDLMFVLCFILLAAMAAFVAPPASFLCAAFGVFSVCAPVLFFIRRRRATTP